MSGRKYDVAESWHDCGLNERLYFFFSPFVDPVLWAHLHTTPKWTSGSGQPHYESELDNSPMQRRASAVLGKPSITNVPGMQRRYTHAPDKSFSKEIGIFRLEGLENCLCCRTKTKNVAALECMCVCELIDFPRQRRISEWSEIEATSATSGLSSLKAFLARIEASTSSLRLFFFFCPHRHRERSDAKYDLHSPLSRRI